MDRVEERGDRRREVGDGERGLGARVAADREDRLLVEVLGAELEADRNTLREREREASEGERVRRGGKEGEESPSQRGDDDTESERERERGDDAP